MATGRGGHGFHATSISGLGTLAVAALITGELGDAPGARRVRTGFLTPARAGNVPMPPGSGFILRPCPASRGFSLPASQSTPELVFLKTPWFGASASGSQCSPLQRISSHLHREQTRPAGREDAHMNNVSPRSTQSSLTQCMVRPFGWVRFEYFSALPARFSTRPRALESHERVKRST